MSYWRTFLRLLLTANLLFLLVLGFSYWQTDFSAPGGTETLVVIVLATIPTLLTIAGVVVVTSVGWDPF